MNCPDSYEYNPFSNTCYRIVKLLRSWQNAKSYCEDAGEYLATFGSLESAFWFVTLRQSNPGIVLYSLLYG